MDHQALTRAIARLTHVAVWDVSGQSMLRELAEVAARALPADGVGVVSTDAGGNRFVHASTAAATRLERLQELSSIGPCRDAATSGQLVVASHATAAAAWPEFASAALGVGIHTMAAVPLMSRGRCWGVLDLYRGPGILFDREELEAAETLAEVAASHVVMATDREAFRQVEDELARRATHDQVTGLATRALLDDRLKQALRTAPGRGRSVGVIVVDVHGLRQVNDTHGYAGGDEVLREVATRLGSATSESDSVGRLAGNEFVILCPDLPSQPAPVSMRALHTVADTVRASLTPTMQAGGHTVTVRAGVGAALADRPARSTTCFAQPPTTPDRRTRHEAPVRSATSRRQAITRNGGRKTIPIETITAYRR